LAAPAAVALAAVAGAGVTVFAAADIFDTVESSPTLSPVFGATLELLLGFAAAFGRTGET